MSTININANNFKEIVTQSEKPVLIDFWASWCGPCRRQSPIIEELSNEVDNSAVIAKLNVDENPEIASQFSVRSIPTLVIVKSGKIVDRKVGLTTKADLKLLLGSLNA